jgi:hypothetical protein
MRPANVVVQPEHKRMITMPADVAARCITRELAGRHVPFPASVAIAPAIDPSAAQAMRMEHGDDEPSDDSDSNQ